MEKKVLFDSWDFNIFDEEDNFMCFDDDLFNYYYDEITDILFNNTNGIVLTGTLGLWTGRHATSKWVRDEYDFKNLVSNYDDIRIYQEGIKLYLDLLHHDGTNSFEIRKVVDKLPEYQNTCDDFGDMIEYYVSLGEQEKVNNMLKNYTRVFRYSI